MKQLHDRLRNDHHLRHSARQQYGLFLKGIGVTLEDALKFWRSEFTKKMDIEKVVSLTCSICLFIFILLIPQYNYRIIIILLLYSLKSLILTTLDTIMVKKVKELIMPHKVV